MALNISIIPYMGIRVLAITREIGLAAKGSRALRPNQKFGQQGNSFWVNPQPLSFNSKTCFQTLPA